MGCLNNVWGRCKAQFPHLVVLFTFVDETGHLVIKKLEPWLNTVAPVMTFLLRCNTDATCLKSGTAIKAAVFYLTNYITKSVLKTSVIFDTIRKHIPLNPEILTTDPNRNERVHALMTKIVNGLSAKMEIGGPLATSYLLGLPDHYTSHWFASFYWQPFVHEVRSFWDSSVVSNVKPKVTIVKVRDRVIGLSPIYDYIYRPRELENVSLYDWISCCSRERNKTAFKKPTASNKNREVEQDESSLPQELSVEDGVSSPLLPSCDPVDIPVGVFCFAPEHPLYETHAVRVRTARFQAIPNFSGASLPRHNDEERASARGKTNISRKLANPHRALR